MKNALFYEKIGNNIVKCKLCPHYCIIRDGERGACKVRTNKEGDLFTEIFEKVAAYGMDPVEKKPLYHFYPGHPVLSIGAIGCNLHCSFCQNYRISQISPDEFDNFYLYTASEIVEKAKDEKGNLGIAFTYNEPGTFYEYMLQICLEAQGTDLKTIMVTNGYINREPLEQLLPHMNAFNVDLKAFSEGFYKSITKSKLAPVKKNIQRIAKSDSHMEITNLVIPGLNDSHEEFEEMVSWIAGETGEKTPLHISRYFPYYKSHIEATPLNTILDLFDIAQKHLKYVYLGNILDNRHSNTYCDQCGHKVIDRASYHTMISGLDKSGDCTKCGNHIIDYLYP